MKKFLLFLICCNVAFSCKKGNIPSKNYPSETQQITGVLHYDNFPDGWGLYYSTDHENLILKNEFSSPDAQYQHFKQFVGLNTRLYFEYKGDTSCLYGIGPVCGIRVVEVVDLVKE